MTFFEFFTVVMSVKSRFRASLSKIRILISQSRFTYIKAMLFSKFHTFPRFR